MKSVPWKFFLRGKKLLLIEQGVQVFTYLVFFNKLEFIHLNMVLFQCSHSEGHGRTLMKLSWLKNSLNSETVFGALIRISLMEANAPSLRVRFIFWKEAKCWIKLDNTFWIDLIIHSSSQETIRNSACITIFLNSHILLILSQWYWLFLPFSSLSFHLSFESHLSFLDDINSALTHLPVFSLLSLHSLTQSKDNSISKITLSLPCQIFFCTTILLLSSKVLF